MKTRFPMGRLLVSLLLMAGGMSQEGCSDQPPPDETPQSSPTPTTLEGNLSASTQSLSFPDTEVEQVAELPLTLTNTGTADLSITLVGITGTGSSAFQLKPGSPDPSGSTLASESSVELVVQFYPTTTGSKEAILRIVSNDADQPQLDVALSGTGTPGSGEPDGDNDGYTVSQGDCNDKDPTIHPSATEVCDNKDNDCDNVTDEEATDAPTWYADTDADDHGDPNSSIQACKAPANYASSSDDCNDDSADAYPGATEICDQLDNDCDGQIDENGTQTYYADSDQDGHGDASNSRPGCTAPAGYTTSADDCDDSDSSVYPAAPEICDLQDNDCDGAIDEDGATLFYADADGDGHGDPEVSMVGCSLNEGYVSTGDDCDDLLADVYPGAPERCDGLDNDCDDSVDEDASDAFTWYTDADGDTFGTGDPMSGCTLPSGSADNAQDCDDANASIHPGVTETCNSKDDNCDGSIDNSPSDALTFYQDADQDGHGSQSATRACSAPAGYTTSSDDCNDNDSKVYPGANEACDGIDNDCNGQIDEKGQTTIYVDADRDGYGNSAQSSQGCAVSDGYSGRGGDCNDNAPSINPGVSETCNGVDDNCDAQIDNGVLLTFYQDLDADGYGNAAQTTTACSLPIGYASRSGDCNDAAASVNPGATETCNQVDDDCDGQTDEEASNASTWYADTDGDSYGQSANTVKACTKPAGYVAAPGSSSGFDCNDQDASIHPGASEVCNAKDDNCNGSVDDSPVDARTWYLDADQDGYGGVASVSACNAPSGYIAQSGDCNDSNANIHPGATELCNSVDDDCDAQVDEGVSKTWYLDRDEDGYGDSSKPTQACTAPTQYVAQSGDCNDLDTTINPGATEKCNSKDDNCNGVTDESTASDAATWYADTDNDGYGNSASTQKACSKPGGYVSNSTDCNDADATINPAATETCNSKDDNCNGTIDDGATNAATWYLDGDKDTYGNASNSQKSCTQPTGYVSNNTDCNDSNPSIYPGATEVCDGVDQSCNGQVDEGVTTTFYIDRDEDTYGDASKTTQACAAPALYVSRAGDCNDLDPLINPSASELCNSKDDNCNGTIDESSASDAKTWYLDNDKDGYGTAATSQKACSQPSGYVSSNTDCNDADIAVNPAATELCNSKDDNCNGTIDENTASDARTWYQDADADGYGSALVSQKACNQPSGYVSSNTDCNDSDKTINPGATEVCNTKDDNCNGITDESTATDAKTWYQDADKDTYGNAAVSQKACTQPTGYVADKTDCNDADASTYPGAPEKPADARDNDCDGRTDENGTLATLSVPLTGHSVVYDSTRQRILVFGGLSYYDISATTWELDLSKGNSGTWKALASAGTAPPALYNHTAIYDAASDRMIVFGGQTWYDTSSALYALSFGSNGAAGAWSTLTPTGTLPSARFGHAAFYDPLGLGMWLYGGQTYSDLSGEVYFLDLGASPPKWYLVDAGTGSGRPAPRMRAGITYDAVRDRLILVGGDGYYDRFADVWSLDLNTFLWSQLSPSNLSMLPPLSGATVNYSSRVNAVLIFGGASFYDLSASFYKLDFSGSAQGSLTAKTSTISAPVPVEGSGAVVIETDLLDITVFGQGYYGLLDTPVSLDIQ